MYLTLEDFSKLTDLELNRVKEQFPDLLFTIVKRNTDFEFVEFLLYHGFPIEYKISVAPLHILSVDTSIEMTELLLSWIDKIPSKILMDAISDNHFEKVKLLVKKDILLTSGQLKEACLKCSVTAELYEILLLLSEVYGQQIFSEMRNVLKEFTTSFFIKNTYFTNIGHDTRIIFIFLKNYLDSDIFYYYFNQRHYHIDYPALVFLYNLCFKKTLKEIEVEYDKIRTIATNSYYKTRDVMYLEFYDYVQLQEVEIIKNIRIDFCKLKYLNGPIKNLNNIAFEVLLQTISIKLQL